MRSRSDRGAPPVSDQMTTRLLAKQLAARLVSLARRSPSSGLRFLTYHSVPRTTGADTAQMTTPLDVFERQMQHLARAGLRVVDARSAVRAVGCGTQVDTGIVLTFDDGFLDVYENALPVLQRHGFRATVFVISDVARGTFRTWEHGASSYLDATALREMVRSGLVDVGSHSATHARLRGIRGARLRREVATSRRDLEDLLGRSVDLFAYPYGSFDAMDGSVRRAVIDAGYSGAVTGITGINGPRTDRYLVRRSRVSWADDAANFDRLLRGAYDWYALVQWVQALRRASP